MKKTLLLTLSAAALLSFAAPVWATGETQSEAPEALATEAAPAADTAAPVDAEAEADAELHEDSPVAQGAEHSADTVVEVEEEEHDAAAAGHETIKYPQVDWSFDGPLATFDRASMQRGFQV